MKIASQRRIAVADTVRRIREIAPTDAPDRGAVALILDALKGLAARRDFWGPADYPGPDEGTRQARYLVSEDAERRFALYLNVMLPGRLIPPHNHTTWACVAAVEGEEHNFLYRRLDDGSRPGYAELARAETVVVGPGRGIALLPDDIHAVEIRGERPIRHLHMYGRALETLSERLSFDLESKTCKPMPLGVQTRR